MSVLMEIFPLLGSSAIFLYNAKKGLAISIKAYWEERKKKKEERKIPSCD